MASQISPNERYDRAERRREALLGINYKWIVLMNTTLGALMASIDGSILIISLPAIFSGLHVNPLAGGDSTYLLWLILGYTIVCSVTVAAIGRLSDIFGRVKLYNLGFVIFALSSTLIYIASYMISGTEGIMAIILLRLVQGLGGGFIIANSAAIITDAFPENERGKALGINQIAGVGGVMIGLILGGTLAAVDWHLIFLISVPVGIIGAAWAYYALREIATIRKRQNIDVLGNITFASSILLILIAMTYGIKPYGSSSVGWSNPFVDLSIVASLLLFAAFVRIETKQKDPMFHLSLFKIRSFTYANLSLLLAGIARGGLQFMLVIWLQGIWLPLHGVSFEQTPLQSAYDLIPLIAGFLVMGPISGYMSDKIGARWLTTIGMLINTFGFLLLSTLPINFNLSTFMIITFMMGMGQGMFVSPIIATIMNSVPPQFRGVASGLRATLFQLSNVLSISLFFSMLASGLVLNLSSALYSGLVAQNVSSQLATQISQLPPTSALFAALLGSNPMKTLIPANASQSIPQQNQQVIFGNEFFPGLIAGPFIHSIKYIFYFGAFLTAIAAYLSFIRGKR